MKKRGFLTFLLLVATIGCDGDEKRSAPSIRVAITNASGIDLDWVELKWDGPYVPGGVMPAGVTKSAVDSELPNDKTATVKFVDDKSRAPYSNTISLEELFTDRRDSISEITFRITGYESVEVIVDYRSP